ncbi:unnamed protein product [Ceratitis capitata]|uniref:(Mediterranean fruit fly) hypothetical protein n=1 Tax=Ceratitis capitata TaxID=7213 RepID=A0A811ULP2_CERCA|nr:unnamed protein product [Ceratitis capitata]
MPMNANLKVGFWDFGKNSEMMNTNYAVIIGLIEILSRRCMKIRECIENHQSVVLSLLATLGFLTRFIDVCPPGPTDATRFLSAAKSTELFGSISMLYACVVPIGECIPPRTVSLAAATFNLLVSMAVLDLSTFQVLRSIIDSDNDNCRAPLRPPPETKLKLQFPENAKLYPTHLV